MRSSRKYVFFGVMLLYALYNLFWVVGMTFSWGKNDDWEEAAFIFLTFVADIPIIFFAVRSLRPGLVLLFLVLIGSFTFGAWNQVISSFSLLYWYAPKLISIAAVLWVNRSVRPQSQSVSF